MPISFLLFADQSGRIVLKCLSLDCLTRPSNERRPAKNVYEKCDALERDYGRGI